MEEKKIARENRNEEKLSHGDWVIGGILCNLVSSL